MLKATGDTSDIRLSDVNTLFTTLATTPIGYRIAFDFLIIRWNDIEKALLLLLSIYFNILEHILDILILFTDLGPATLSTSTILFVVGLIRLKNWKRFVSYFFKVTYVQCYLKDLCFNL